MAMKQTNQLIVLGNGFDIACGLNSAYANFFHDRYSLHKWNLQKDDDETEAEMNLVDGMISLDNEGLNESFWDIDGQPTIWDILFLLDYKSNYKNNKKLTDINWDDIESSIDRFLNFWISSHEDFLTSANNKSGINWTVANWINAIQANLINLIQANQFNPFQNKSNFFIFESQLASCLKDFILEHSSISDCSFTDFLKELKHELNQLESDFGKYLTTYAFTNHPGQYSENSSAILQHIFTTNHQKYINTAKKLLAELIEEDTKTLYLLNNSILSFNYTTPFDESDTIRNIHGSTKEPIFGIDSIDSSTDTDKTITDERNMFTKNFRVLELHTSQRYEKILHPDGGNQPLDFIKFFGHSLGDADYSYFRTLFDDVDLYDGNTALMFLYTKGANAAELNANVAHLINKYALSLPEPKQQVNLMTKLTIEGRLNIREIPQP
ncbi:AbiH family protein [Bifidobacterium sp. ESL0745]|uniref:AbiH family protein n=1 Tax=Bifidobacterium sp. ESL0745 TaxID=2983226 RepID=UPI0023F651EB|nr:AbiH family protein [Bifidobacterium sp. ESL0745]MDF7665995.1 AbiH family protein [Bifidobacterium sp. ESL0745]